MTDTKTTVGVVAESGADGRRVALVPKAVSTLVNSGVAVVVQAGAAERALLPDELYTDAGATIGDAWAADVVVKVAPPSAEEVARLRSGMACPAPLRIHSSYWTGHARAVQRNTVLKSPSRQRLSAYLDVYRVTRVRRQ